MLSTLHVLYITEITGNTVLQKETELASLQFLMDLSVPKPGLFSLPWALKLCAAKQHFAK